jgi:hypothetical protein
MPLPGLPRSLCGVFTWLHRCNNSPAAGHQCAGRKQQQLTPRQPLGGGARAEIWEQGGWGSRGEQRKAGCAKKACLPACLQTGVHRWHAGGARAAQPAAARWVGAFRGAMLCCAGGGRQRRQQPLLGWLHAAPASQLLSAGGRLRMRGPPLCTCRGRRPGSQCPTAPCSSGGTGHPRWSGPRCRWSRWSHR